jgi:uncharacterized protein (AIM24 family)
MKPRIIIISSLLLLPSALSAFGPGFNIRAIDNVLVASVPISAEQTGESIRLPIAFVLLDESALLPAAPQSQTTAKPDAAETARLKGTSSSGFQENLGQIVDTDGKARPDIKCTAIVNGATLYFRKDGVSTVFMKSIESFRSTAPPAAQDDISMLHDPENIKTTFKCCRMDMTLPGCNPDARIRTEGELEGFSNYYLAYCPQGITGVKKYSRIVYENIYDRIDLEYLSSNGRLKYNFIVHPGGRVGDIRMRYTGAGTVTLSDEGRLELSTPAGSSEEERPYTYQRSGEVACEFALQGDEVSFDVGSFDTAQDLIIDPWATYHGGASEERALTVATDGSGNVVATGYTNSANFPVTNSSTYAGGCDVFVLKYNGGGNIVWATYYGGTGTDGLNSVNGSGIATDGSGNVLITGSTESTNLPVTNSSTYAGLGDAFVVKFSGSGTVVWATYYGGSAGDVPDGIAVDGSGNLVLTGYTGSTNFPVTNSSTLNGSSDAFVAEFNGSGTGLWSTYCGGSGSDYAKGVATDGSGNVVITGLTTSTNFPVTNSSTLSSSNGDAFVVKFSGSGIVQWATYCGGSNFDRADDIATDGSGNVFITGQTSSTNFPVTNSSTLNGSNDAFVVKFSGSGPTVLWAIYNGGGSTDGASGIATDGSGNVVIAGSTSSTNYPVTNSSTFAGVSDAFVTKFNSTGTTVLWATYLGGSGYDYGYDVATDGSGNVVIAGSTTSTNFPVTNSSVKAGDIDVFVAHFDASGNYPVEIASFTAQITPAGAVQLQWTTSSEIGNYGFEIQRSFSAKDDAWEARGFVPGAESNTAPREYSFIDEAPAGTYSERSVFYRLKQIDVDGTVQYSPVVEAFPGGAPQAMTLSHPYPQPASRDAVVRFTLREADRVSITLHDVLGREAITLLAAASFGAGTHAVQVRWQRIPAGVYFLQLLDEKGSVVRRMVVR